MFATQFNYNKSFAQWELKVDTSKANAVVAYLNMNNCRGSVTYFGFGDRKYALVELINPSVQLINALNSKFNQVAVAA